MMVVLDEATRYSEMRLLAHTSDAAAQLLQVISKWERITGHQVAAVRSDRGGEWTSNCLQQELASRGIQQELTAAYSPESDGAAERLSRTLLFRRCCPTPRCLPPSGVSVRLTPTFCATCRLCAGCL